MAEFEGHRRQTKCLLIASLCKLSQTAVALEKEIRWHLGILLELVASQYLVQHSAHGGTQFAVCGGMQCVVCGLRSVVCGLWFAVCGLWFVRGSL